MEYKYLKDRGALAESKAPTRQVPGSIAGFSPRLTKTPQLSQAEVHRLLRQAPSSFTDLIPESIAREHRVFPIIDEGETLTVAAVHPDDIALEDKLRFITARNVRLVLAAEAFIQAAIDRSYGLRKTDSVDSMICEFTDTAIDFDEDCAGFKSRPTARGKSMQGIALSAPGVEYKRGTATPSGPGLDTTTTLGGQNVFSYVVEEGQRVLVRRPNGTIEIIVGPRKVFRGRKIFRPMEHYVAHPGEFLIVRYRDGRQEHVPGPTELWFDPRVHQRITREEALQIANREAIVVYCQPREGAEEISRRIVYGPALFVPEPGEWLHTFSWHGSKGGSQGVDKIANSLVFQKLWLMPDQMYHDIRDVRTGDDAVLTIRLMIFFELLDIERMLETTHDPIGDLVNAATSDVVEFTGKHDFEAFKHHTNLLNELETYKQLINRASQCGYRINKVVYRGYGAPESLQQMHNQAIEARTRLQLERANEQQAQDLENYKLDCQLTRASKRRGEQTAEIEHELTLTQKKQTAERQERGERHQQALEQRRRERDQEFEQRTRQHQQEQAQLDALRNLGVDLTAYLTQSRADRVIELRGGSAGTHLHLDQIASENDHPQRTKPPQN